RLCFVAAGNAIALAEVRAADPGPAADDALTPGRRAARIEMGACPVVPLAKPVGAPLPDITRDVIEAVAVRRKPADRGSAAVAVFARVARGKRALPDVGHVPAAGAEFVTPRIDLPGQSAARGVLEFGFRGQTLVRPFRIGHCVIPGHLH